MPRAWADLHANAMAEVQKHFLANPDQIPDPSKVREARLVSLGGVLAALEREAEDKVDETGAFEG
jgi:hypothetical protein